MLYLIVASGSLSIFIIALVLGKKRKGVSDYILVIWLFLFVLNFVSLFLLNTSETPFGFWETVFYEFSNASIFLHGPILFFYTLSLTTHDFLLKPKYGYHAVPFFLGFLFFLVSIFMETGSALRNVLLVLKMTSLLLYSIFVIILLRTHRLNVKNIFSNADDKYLKWLTFLSWGIVIIWTIVVGSLVIDRLTEINIPQYGGLLTNLAICIFVFLMGYFGINQTSIFTNDFVERSTIKVQADKTKEISQTDLKYKKSGLDADGANDIYNRLKALMAEEKPYLEKELTLFSLADILDVQPNHLSQVINSLEGKNFFDYINEHRIALAKEKIASNEFQYLTLLGIAFDCGFSSKASFNRAFKKFTGKTPTEFKQI